MFFQQKRTQNLEGHASHSSVVFKDCVTETRIKSRGEVEMLKNHRVLIKCDVFDHC